MSHQGYYQWKTRVKPERTKSNRVLSSQIEAIYHEHDGNGCPRIYATLRAKGIMVNHERVERIMRDSGLAGKTARLYRRKALPERFV